jgi:hypothetical protein
MRYKHVPTGREVTIYTYADGSCRLAAYVVGDGGNWKRTERQIVVNLDQAIATIARKELYIAMDVGVSARSLLHSRELEPI